MLNSVNIIGRLTKDVEVRYTTNGKAVCDFTIACNRLQEGVDFINIQVWGKQAENLCKYTSKGDLVSIIGKLRTDEFNDKEGNKRTKTYILATEIGFITTGKRGEKIEKEVNKLEDTKEYIMRKQFEDFGNEIDNAEESNMQLPF